MSVTWAYIFGQPDSDPVRDRFELERGGQRSIMVPVPDESQAASIALSLLDEGVELIELCGGFTLQDAGRVVEAVGGRVPVGHVTFGVESAPGVAAYSQKFTAETP